MKPPGSTGAPTNPTNCASNGTQPPPATGIKSETESFLDTFDSKDGVKEECGAGGGAGLPFEDFKEEDLKGDLGDFGNDFAGLGGAGGPLGPGPMGLPPGPPTSSSPHMPMNMPPSQPLPSNVLSKQQSSLDQQYMQQSSQIFVFSTDWANRGATAVMDQQAPSIISWHESQPETKKQLEEMAIRFPNLKQTMMQPNNMRFSQMNKMMKGPKGQPIMPPGVRPGGPGGPGGPPGGMGPGLPGGPVGIGPGGPGPGGPM